MPPQLHICKSELRDRVLGRLSDYNFYATEFGGDIHPLSEVYFEVVAWYDKDGDERAGLVVDTHSLDWMSSHIDNLGVDAHNEAITDGANRAYEVHTQDAYRLNSPLVRQSGDVLLDVWPHLLRELNLNEEDCTPYLILKARCFHNTD